MADFRRLALEFVLEDNKAKSIRIAQQAAKGWYSQTHKLVIH